MTATESKELQDTAAEAAEPSDARRSRRPRVAIAAIVVVVVAAGGLWLLLGQHSAARSAAPPTAPVAAKPAGQGPGPTGGATTQRAGSVGQALVPVSSYFTGPDPFVPKISQASGQGAGTTPAGG